MRRELATTPAWVLSRGIEMAKTENRKPKNRNRKPGNRTRSRTSDRRSTRRPSSA